MHCTPPGSSVHGIFQARGWSGLPFPPPGDLPHPGMEPASCIAGRCFTAEPLGRPIHSLTHSLISTFYHMFIESLSWAGLRSVTGWQKEARPLSPEADALGGEAACTQLSHGHEAAAGLPGWQL